MFDFVTVRVYKYRQMLRNHYSRLVESCVNHVFTFIYNMQWFRNVIHIMSHTRL